MINYIIATHGHLSEGILSALKLLIGEGYNIDIIAAYVDDIPLDVKFQDIFNKYDEDSSTLIFTDILGGSINQYFLRQIIEGLDIHVITGINLALILELVLKLECTIDEQTIMETIETAREQMLYVNQLDICKNINQNIC